MGTRKVLMILGLVALGIILTAAVFFLGSRNLEKSELGNDDSSFRVALVTSGTKDDSPLVLSAYNGILSGKDSLGLYLSLRENVSAADLEYTLRSYALEGYDLIYVNGEGFGVAAKELAGDFPKVAFVALNAKLANSKNMGSVYLDYRAVGFIKGVAAAYMSRNGVVAAVGGVQDLSTTAELFGFQKGVFSVNPNIQVHADFASNLGAGKTAADLASTYLGYGADVIDVVSGKGDDGVIAAAEKKNAYVLGSSDMLFQKYPQTVLASVQTNLETAVAGVTKQVHDGTYKAEPLLVDTTFLYNPSLKARVSATIEAKIKDVIDKIMKGELKMDVLVPMES